MADVKLFGHSFKPWQVAAVGAGGGLVTWYAVRQHQAASAAASSAGSALDPVTGLTDAQDVATYGSVAAADAAFQGGGSSGYGYGSVGAGTSYGPAGTGSTVLGTTSGGGYASNADWDQAATAGLTSLGYSTADVANALGRYLAGLSLDPGQQNIVNVALGEFGNPPSGALPIIAAPQGTATSGSTSTSGGTTSGSTSTSGGTTSGSTAASKPSPPPVPGGFRQVNLTANEIGLAWNPSPGATGYVFRITYQGALAGETFPTSPGGTVHGLSPNRTYTCHVAAVGPGGTSAETNGPVIKTPA